jgi:hypothetical protein
MAQDRSAGDRSTSRRTRAWQRFSFPISLLILVVGWEIRQSSGIGWLALGQTVMVVPWLAPLLLPVTVLATLAAVERSWAVARVVGLAAVAVLLSAVTVDSTDQADCFLGACSDDADPWWWEVDIVWSTPQIAITLSFIALLLEVLAVCMARRIRKLANR